MAQHDYVADDADGATYRQDVNNALLAIATWNSGATAPATPYAGLPWWDTANNLVKRRNSANTAWVTVASYDGTTWIPYAAGVPLDQVAQTDTAQTFTAAQRGNTATLTYGATVNTNLALANHFEVTLAGNPTLANPTNMVKGQEGTITFIQDATGGRIVGAYGTYWKFENGEQPTFAAVAGAKDLFAYKVVSTTEIVLKRAAGAFA